jgi:hypothetical protein
VSSASDGLRPLFIRQLNRLRDVEPYETLRVLSLGSGPPDGPVPDDLVTKADGTTSLLGLINTALVRLGEGKLVVTHTRPKW